MNEILGIYHHSQRATQSVEAAVAWARSRNINTIVVGEFQLAELNLLSVDAIYIPIYWGFDLLSAIDKSIPLIIDIDAMGDRVLEWYSEFAKDRLVATRTFSLNKKTASEYIKFQVPYIHLPISDLPQVDERDLIFIDIHEWEKHLLPIFKERVAMIRSFDSSMTSYCNCRDLGYGDLPYLYKFHDFRHIIARMRVLISTHSWLSDIDVFNAYLAGIPLLCLDVTNYHHPMQQAMLYLEPDLSQEFNNMLLEQRYEWGQLPSIRCDVPAQLFANAYLRVWDLLWQWVVSGSIDKTLMDLTVNQ